MISVVLPVKNGGEDLRRCLVAIESQQLDEEVEVVVVDSSSTDGSAELARRHGARVHVIPAVEFNHGRTRNLGAELARGDTLVFTSQDAYADGPRWLSELVAPLRSDARIAGVYGRQLPHDDAKPPERYFLDFLYGPEPRRQAVEGVAGLTMETTLFSNVNSAVRRPVWEELLFAEDMIMSEDQEWSARVLLAGYTIAYEPRAVVRHSHPYTIRSAFRRFFDSGVSAERAYLAGGRPAAQVLRRAASRYARDEVAWLWRTGQLSWVPYSAAYELAKYLGLQLGLRHRRLPARLKLRLTGNPGYWDRHEPAEPPPRGGHSGARG